MTHRRSPTSKPHGTTHGATNRTAAPNGVSTTRTANQSAWPAPKTSIKDRFRQVADEANRIRDKHLFTLTPGDVTHPKLAQLDELHIHLVMPKVVKESYDDLIQGETMTFSRFIEEIQGLQADRPQSLTLL